MKLTDITNPLEPFKFWASKRVDIAVAYLDKYAQRAQVLFDPFAGSGAFVYASLLKGIKAIFNDLSPYALFLARNVLKPVDLKLIQSAVNEVLERKVEVNFPFIKELKNDTVNDVIKWFYETSCDVFDENTKKICNQKTVVEYFVWDTQYLISKKIGDRYALEQQRKGDKRYRIFLDVICNLQAIKLKNKKRLVYTFSRKLLNEKWKLAFDKNPKLWIKLSTRKKYGPALVNEVVSNLIKQDIAIRATRKPILKKITCPIHGELLLPLSNSDKEKIREIEKIKIPYSDFIPNVRLAYFNNSKEPKLFKTFRRSVFVLNETLSTVEKEEQKTGIPKLKNYFTKRNLIALNLLMWSISKIKDVDLRFQVYLVFVSRLHKLAKFESLATRWGSNNYACSDEFLESNVLENFLKAWKKVKKIKESIWRQATSIRPQYTKYVFDETFDVKDFLTHLNEPNKKTVLWLREDARNIKELIKRKIVDIVFTDPPYKAEKESIQYFELTSFFGGWLHLDPDWKNAYGDFDWWKDELIDNVQQGKSEKDYFKQFNDCFLSIDSIVKDNALWIITYHTSSKTVWEGVRNCLGNLRLRVPTFEEIKTHQIRARGRGSFYVTRHGSIGEDAYIVLTRAEAKKETLKLAKELSEQEFLNLLLTKMKDFIIKNEGVIPKDAFSHYFPDIVIKYGGMYGNSESYKTFFENITVHLSDTMRLLDRSKIGEELYNKIYKDIPPLRLLRKVLIVLGADRKEITASELELLILPKIDGRIDDATKIKVLKEIFNYNVIENKYILKEQPLARYFPKAIKKEAIPLPLPQEVTARLKETAKKYGAHTVTEGSEKFSLTITTSKSTYLIAINDERGIRRYAGSTSDKDRENKIIVYLYYPKDKNLKPLIKLLKPAILVAIPYEKLENLIDAFKEYEPLDALKKYIIKW